jgi:hypothetical protein
MKTCEYCGSEVPDETLVCPNCAAHFEIPPQPPPWPPPLPGPDPGQPPLDQNLFKSRLDRSYWNIGKVVVTLFVVYLALMFIGVLGAINRWLLLAGILLVAAVLILRKALRS